MSDVQDKDFDEEVNRIGTARGALRRKLQDENPEMAKMFQELTPAQKAYGQLSGKLMEARSFEDIENAFAWWEVLFGETA